MHQRTAADLGGQRVAVVGAVEFVLAVDAVRGAVTHPRVDDAVPPVTPVTGAGGGTRGTHTHTRTCVTRTRVSHTHTHTLVAESCHGE